MTPLRLFTRSCAAIALMGSVAVACPLGDCSGEHRDFGGPAGDGVPIYFGMTGSHAKQVDVSGTPVITDRVAVLLEHRTGNYPSFRNNRALHGGIPQRANIDQHLRKFARDLNREIPDRDFDGYAIIDYETWKPFWDTRWGHRDHFQEESRRYVRQRFPNMHPAQVEALAKEEFETAAREFMLATLREGKRLRPNAKWGYYAYLPGFHGDAEDSEEPRDLSWLWNEVDAIYPSSYVRNYSRDRLTRARGEWHINEMRARTREKMEQAESVAGDKPILVFVHRYYKNNNPIYGGQPLNDLDFEASFLYPVELGADALILWDAVNSISTKRDIEQDLRTGLLGQRFAEADILAGSGGGVVAPERRRVTGH